MKQFGTNEYGNREGFKIVCCKCGKEGWGNTYTSLCRRRI